MNNEGRHRKAGQSIVLFALLLVVIIGMVGLAVDVGNAFGQERYIQNGANAGALSGMNSVVLEGQKNADVWTNVQRTLAGNHVNNGGAEYTYWADYVLENGSVVRLGDWNGYNSELENGGSAPPQNVARVQITMQKRVETFFVRMFGREDFTVTVNGNACLGSYGMGVLPMGVPLNLQKFKLGNGNKAPETYHRIYNAGGGELATTSSEWGSWSNMPGRSIYLPVENWSDSVPGTHVAWLSWNGANGANVLKDGMTYPGTLQDGFVEGPVLDAARPNTQPAKKLTRGDWVNGDTGVKASLKDQLQTLKDDKREIGLPIYDASGKENGKTTFHVVKVGLFRVADFSLTSGTKYIKVEYLGDKYGAPSACAGEPGPRPPTPKKFQIAGTTKVNEVWRSAISDTTNDIVIVMDTSASMYFDWNDRKPSDSGYQYPRLNDARRVVKDFVRGYDLEADPDARISFVTFGGTTAQTGSPAKLVTDWAESGCTLFQITSTLCTDNMKWPQIQAKASRLVGNGYTPGPIALELAEQLLKNKRTPKDGKTYNQIVLFATDGVFNVCGRDKGEQPCPYGKEVPRDGSSTDAEYYLNNPAYNQTSGRPIWQAQQVANRIKQSGAQIFIVALMPRGGAFAPVGLPEISTGTDYYYEADNGGALNSIYTQINEQIGDPQCLPRETPGQIAPGAQIRLKHPTNPNNDIITTADGNGKWSFKDIVPGTYTIELATSLRVRSRDGLTREYSQVVNALYPAEKDQMTVNVTSELPNGAKVRAEMLLTTRAGTTGAPADGCETPE